MVTLITSWITESGSTLVLYPTIDDITLFHSILDCLSCTYRNLNLESKRMYVSYFKYNLVTFDESFRANIESLDNNSILSKISITFDINIYICKRYIYDTVISNKYISNTKSPTILILHNSDNNTYHPLGIHDKGQNKSKMILFHKYDHRILTDINTYDINTEYKNPYNCYTNLSHTFYLEYNTSKFLK